MSLTLKLTAAKILNTAIISLIIAAQYQGPYKGLLKDMGR
jgi:hypothetical protein